MCGGLGLGGSRHLDRGRRRDRGRWPCRARRRPAARAVGSSRSCWRPATGSAAGCSTRRSATARWSRSAASGSGRPRSGSRPGRRAWGRHLPDLRRGAAPDRDLGGKLASYTGALTDARLGLVRDLSRVISPLALVDFEQARARARPDGAAGAAGGALDGAEGGELGRADLRHLGRGATPAPRRRAASSSWRPRRSGRPSPPTSRSSTSSSTRAPAAASTACSAPAAAPSRTASTAARSGSRS